MSKSIRTAFVLGAGLGTRLGCLTAERPKPLVPVFHKPLITFAFDHLRAAGVGKFVVNTHHRPEAYDQLLGAAEGRTTYEGLPVHLSHEPVLLDTGGGIGNVRELLGSEPFLVHNGDVLADLPLGRLIESHFAEGNAATLLLRSSGGPAHVQFDPQSGLVTDIRGSIGGQTAPGYLFTGIYILSPVVFAHIPLREKCSVVPVFLKMMKAGERIGGLVLDEGRWCDLGTREAYLQTHRDFFPGRPGLSYPLDRPWPRPVHPEARVEHGVQLEGCCAVGAGAVVKAGARLHDTIVWENANIASRASLDACIVRDGRHVSGTQLASDI